MVHNKIWFVERIWKRVFLDDDGCSCSTCKDVVENGIVIFDENHASYMCDVQNDFWCEWVYLNYRDKK